jgi:citronellol/citronellal dehydrogenase
MPLQNRVVLITGASRGIGRACAIACARAGADVVIAARGEGPGLPAKLGDTPGPPGTLDEVAREIEALGRRALPVRLDVRDEAACEAAVARAVEVLGRVDVLVNNAGALWYGDVVETAPKRFDLVMDVNLRAAFVLSRAVLEHMIRQRFGHIVMMSPPVHEGGPATVAHRAAYAVSKLGMTMIAQAITEETRGTNVTAHALWPATAIESSATLGDTPRTPGAMAVAEGQGRPEERRKADIVADALLFLVSREPSARPGRAWIDEDLLRAEGVTDFSKYQSAPEIQSTMGAPPAPQTPPAPPPSPQSTMGAPPAPQTPPAPPPSPRG